MTDISEIAIGAKLTFDTYGAVNGVTSFTGEKIGNTSGKYLPVPQFAVAAHSSIYPLLPAASKAVTEDSYKSYNYIHFLKDDGADVYIGVPWIQESSVKETIETTGTIVLSNCKNTKGTLLRTILEQNDFEVASITFL